MAVNVQNQSSVDSTLNNLFSQESELDQSESLLPQGEPKTQVHDARVMSQSASSESSFEISGFSTLMTSNDESNSELVDPFYDVFYKVFSSEKSTDIHFYAQTMFDMIVSALDKEYSTPGNDVGKFVLKTHINGQRCNINVNRVDYTITATGPGHVTWKEKCFRKMTAIMFKKFDDKVRPLVDQQIGMSSSETHTNVNSNGCTSTNMSAISALMDKIHSLQNEVTKLTTEVNRLFRQAAESVSNTESKKKDDTNSSQKRVSPNINVDIQDLSGLHPVHGTNTQTTSTADVIHLTSTPVPGSAIPTQIRETPQTVRPRPVIRPTRRAPSQPAAATKTLLIGDSIINGINKNGLMDNVYKHGISGATIQTILNEVKMYDLTQFSHIVIYVGGNNASNKTDTKQFEELYKQVLAHIRQKSDCKIILVNSCPRNDADTTAVNSVIRRLSQEYGTELVDAYKAFHDKNYKLINKYMSKDYIHLSNSGIRRLLGMINVQLEVVREFAYCTYERTNNQQSQNRRYKRTPSGPHIRRANLIYPGQDERRTPCTKCGEKNHETKDCKHAEKIQCHECGYYGHKARNCGPQ